MLKSLIISTLLSSDRVGTFMRHVVPWGALAGTGIWTGDQVTAIAAGATALVTGLASHASKRL